MKTNKNLKDHLSYPLNAPIHVPWLKFIILLNFALKLHNQSAFAFVYFRMFAK